MHVQKKHIIGVLLGLVATIAIYAGYELWISHGSDHADTPILQMPQVDRSREAGIDDIRFVELQIEAVTINMDRYLGWFRDDKGLWQKASVRAVRDLGLIKDYVRRLRFTGPLGELADVLVGISDTLIRLYDSIESKKEDDVEKSFAGLNDVCTQYGEKRQTAIKQDTSGEELAKRFDPNDEETKCVRDQRDRVLYLGAVGLINSQKYVQAYKDLAALQAKYKGASFEHCITLRMSKCLFMLEPNEQSDTVFDPQQGIDLLSGILDSQTYSPVLFPAFCEWRTHAQSFWHGMSNLSEIANLEYNLKRWQAVQTIRQYCKAHPQDAWAGAQARLLLSLPNIGRGGLFGNDNLRYEEDIDQDGNPREK